MASKLRGPQKKQSDNLLGAEQSRLGKSMANPRTQVSVGDDDDAEDYKMTPNRTNKGKKTRKRTESFGSDKQEKQQSAAKAAKAVAPLKKLTESITGKAKTVLTQNDQKKHQMKGE